MKVRLFLMLAVLMTGTPGLWADNENTVENAAKNAEPSPPRTVTITISPETTYITEPLLPDGRVDYYGAMHMRNSVGITKENNILPAILAIIPGERESSLIYYPENYDRVRTEVEDYRQRYWKCLGFDAPPPLESLRFLIPAVKHGEELEYLLKYYTPEEIFSRLPYFELLKDEDKNLGLLEYLEKIQGENNWWLSWAIKHDFNQALVRPWTKEEFPLLADWIVSMDEITQKLIDASRRPRFYNPVIASSDEDTFVYSALLPYLQSMRDTARFLSVRGNWHFARGEYDEAFECAFASQRIGLGFRSNASWAMEDMLGIAICRIANDWFMTYLVELEGQKDAQWLAAKRAEYAANLKAYPTPEIPKWINWERCGMLSTIQAVAINREKYVNEVKNDFKEEDLPPAHLHVLHLLSDKEANYDWNKGLRLVNEHFDELEDIFYLPGFERKQRAYTRQEKRLAALNEELETRTPDAGPEQFMVDVALCYWSPFIRSSINARAKADFEAKSVDATFALAMYRSDKGEYPETLELLVPKYLDEVPVSPFNDKPICYCKRDDILLISASDDYKLDGTDEVLEQAVTTYYVNSSPKRTVYDVSLYAEMLFLIILRY